MEQALALIAAAKATRATRLDLGNCGLTELPAALFELTWLEELSLSDMWWEYDLEKKGGEWIASSNRGEANNILALPPAFGNLKKLKNLILREQRALSDISPLQGLVNLQQLDASSTQVSDISPLQGLVNLQRLDAFDTQVSDLLPLQGLVNLRRLSINSTRVSDLSSLQGLVNLQILDVSYTQVSDLLPLQGLTNLQILDVSDTYVSNLSPLQGLVNLQHLYASATYVSDLSPLQGLVNLQHLYASATEVDDLSPLQGLVNLQHLYASATEVDDLSPLQGLIHLQELDVSSTQVNNLSPLQGLVHLQELDVSSTQVSNLSPLRALVNLQKLNISGTQVNNLSPLQGLVHLQELDISSMQVSDLLPLQGLVHLQELDVSSTQVSDLSPLGALVNLQKLNVSSTQVSDLLPLQGLVHLRELDVSSTQVSDLSPLGALVNLQRLSIYSTQVSDLSPLKNVILKGLPVKWEKTKYWGVSGIYVEDCPLDKALIAAIKKGQKAVIRYFEQPKVPLYEARVLVLGEPRAGKTTLRRKLKSPKEPMPTPKESTKAFEVEIEPYKCSIEKEGEKKPMTYHLWDFGGQDYYRLLHQLFVAEQSVYVIVTDTDRNKNEEEIDFWLDTIQRLGRNKNGRYGPVLLLQNPKTNREGNDFLDLKKRYPFWQQNERFVINLNALSEDTEAFERQELERFKRFKTTLEQSFCQLDHVGKLMPADWIKVRKALVRYEKENWIPTEKFYSICSGKGIRADETADLLDIFHTLGYIQHYKNTALQGMVILKREWVTDALYRVLDDATVRKNKGWFVMDDAKKIWSEPHYKNRTRELLALMQEFKLSYLNEAAQRYIVPAKLPEDEEGLPKWDTSQNVRLHLVYDWLPRAVPIQLIVTLHDNLVGLEHGEQWIWRRGAVLDGSKLELTNVQVRIFENWRENKIEISAKGEHSEVLLRTIMAAWRKVHEPFEGKVTVQKQILCACETCQKIARPFIFEYEDVLNAVADDGNLQCNKSRQSFKGASILKGLFAPSTVALDIFEKQGTGVGKELYDLIAANRLDEVFDKLTENGENEWIIDFKRRYVALKSAYNKNTISFEQYSLEESKIVHAVLTYLTSRSMRHEAMRGSQSLEKSNWLEMMERTRFEFNPVINVNVHNENKNTNVQKNDAALSREIAELKTLLAQLPAETQAKLKDFVETLPEPEDAAEKVSAGKQILRWLNKNAEGIVANVSASVYYDAMKKLLEI